MKKLNNKGFTLIEVLAAISIVVILGLISVPSVINTMNTGKNASYQILVQNIKTASQQLFEEVEYANDTLYHYNFDGKKDTKIQISNGNRITVNLQTLVSNGFLTGSNNDETGGVNKNKKIILNPKNNQDIGECTIMITKSVAETNQKTSYQVTNQSSSNSNCPTNNEYQ